MHFLQGKIPGHMTFIEYFSQISHYVGSLNGQMTHW